MILNNWIFLYTKFSYNDREQVFPILNNKYLYLLLKSLLLKFSGFRCNEQKIPRSQNGEGLLFV